jgi:hypothetical protein
MEIIDRRLEELDREITAYEPDSLGKKKTKAFLVSSCKRLNLIVETVSKYSRIIQSFEGKRTS